MSSVFGGAQSIFTCAYDEAFQIPTEFSAELALRTQQIIAFEVFQVFQEADTHPQVIQLGQYLLIHRQHQT